MTTLTPIQKISTYRSNPRPGDPISFPFYVTDELQKISLTLGQIVESLKDLDTRLKTLEP